MKKCLLVVIILVAFVGLSGCETHNKYALPVKVTGSCNSILFNWKDNKGEEKEVLIYVTHLEKLIEFASQLEKCSGYYECKRVGPYYISNGFPLKEGETHTEILKCNEILPRSQMTQEFNNGYICNRCREYRQKELQQKIESLKAKKL